MTLPLLLLAAGQAVVDVPFRMMDDAFVVDATVNGVKGSFLFDTGFGGSVVIDNTLNIGKPTGKMTLRDFVGTLEAATIPVKTLAIGGRSISTEGMMAVQQQMANISLDYGTHIDGLLGFETLKHDVVEINFEKGLFRFYPKTTDIGKRAPDNRRTFLAKLLPLGADALVMDVALKSGRKLVMSLDTGNAFYVTTHKDSLERAGEWAAGRKANFLGMAGVASGPVDTFDKRMRDTTIFGIPVADSVWEVIDLPSSDADADGTVGYQFLRNFNITIDYERRRVWFENWSGKVVVDEPSSVGISASTDPKSKRVVIARVSPDSPAAKAGIKEGDQVLAIDGKDLTDNYSFQKVSKMLSGAKDSVVKLAVSRNGQLTRYELVRQLLVND